MAMIFVTVVRDLVGDGSGGEGGDGNGGGGDDSFDDDEEFNLFW